MARMGQAAGAARRTARRWRRKAKELMNTQVHHRWLCWVALLLLGTCIASAADTATTNTPAAGITDETLRDPFLPLDAGIKADAVDTPTTDPKLADTPAIDPRALLRVQGFVRKGDRVYAVINGRMASKGDIISIQTGDTTYRFLVRDITNRNVLVDLVP